MKTLTFGLMLAALVVASTNAPAEERTKIVEGMILRNSERTKVVEKNEEYYERTLKHATWRWEPNEANVLHSIFQYGRDYQVETTSSADQQQMAIRFVKDGQLRFSWNGQPTSVFVRKDNILAYAVFCSSATGCKLVGVDLDNGKELWRTQLRSSNGMGLHSIYSNSVTMHLDDGAVVVRGNESFYKYIEVVDVKTGTTLANKIFSEDAYSGEVVGVADGNTIRIRQSDKKEVEVRLGGIDCPDNGQTFGAKAKEAASAMSLGKQVRVREMGDDLYGRKRLDIILPNQKSLNRELVRFGFAWSSTANPAEYANRMHCNCDETLATLEVEARQLKVGLWADPKPIPPWEWRETHPTQKKSAMSAVSARKS